MKRKGRDMFLDMLRANSHVLFAAVVLLIAIYLIALLAQKTVAKSGVQLEQNHASWIPWTRNVLMILVALGALFSVSRSAFMNQVPRSVIDRSAQEAQAAKLLTEARAANAASK